MTHVFIRVLKRAGFIMLGIATIATLVILGMCASIQTQTNQRIQSVLTSGYPGKTVAIEDRAEGFLYQYCFDISVSDAQGASSTRHVAMVSGDSDGGVWSFSGEYRTMEECKRAFYRG